MTETTTAGPTGGRQTTGYDALIGLGSNVGEKAHNVARAIELLCADGKVALVRSSRSYRSDPWGILEQDWFVNACVAVSTDLDPHDLLDRCLEVERRLGRVRGRKWGPRLIDVDVLTYRGEEIDSPRLKVPHPLIEQRSFVMLPLAEIAPDEIVRGRTVRDIAAEIDAQGTHVLTEI